MPRSPGPRRRARPRPYILRGGHELVHGFWCHRSCDWRTGEANRLDKYHGGDQVHTASGAGMRINHVGHNILHSPSSKLHLNNILHVPNANKSLVSVNRLACDNNVFLEFHPDHFFIKEQVTRKTLLRGRCEGGLYPSKPILNKQVLDVFKSIESLWHHRLGHASTPVV